MILSGQEEEYPIKKQDTVSSAIEFRFGFGIPRLAFASANDQKPEAGYANTGTFFSASYIKLIKPYIGINVQYASGSNNLREDILSDDIKKSLIESGQPVNGNYSMDFGRYKWQQIMIGPVLYIKEPNYTVVARFLGGNFSLSVPEIEATMSYTDKIYAEFQYGTKENILTLLFGGGLQFNFSERFNLQIMADYLQNNMKFTTRKISTDGENENTENIEFKRKVSMVTLSAGIQYKFFK
ncbi:MAG: hypothetical protein ACOCVN_01260 [bacterium]